MFRNLSKWLNTRFAGIEKLSWAYPNNHRGKTDGRIRLLVFGDSNAYRPSHTGYCWPSLLQCMSDNHLRVINESRDGRTTQFDKGECNGLRVIEKKMRRAGVLEYILIALGTNDVKKKYGPPNPADVVEGIHRIIQTISACSRDAEVVLLTPPPLGKVIHGDLAGAQHRIRPVVAELRRYSIKRRIRLVDLHSIIDVDADLEEDRVHLNASGRRKAAEAVWRSIRDATRMIRDRVCIECA